MAVFLRLLFFLNDRFVLIFYFCQEFSDFGASLHLFQHVYIKVELLWVFYVFWLGLFLRNPAFCLWVVDFFRISGIIFDFWVFFFVLLVLFKHFNLSFVLVLFLTENISFFLKNRMFLFKREAFLLEKLAFSFRNLQLFFKNFIFFLLLAVFVLKRAIPHFRGSNGVVSKLREGIFLARRLFLLVFREFFSKIVVFYGKVGFRVTLAATLPL